MACFRINLMDDINESISEELSPCDKFANSLVPSLIDESILEATGLLQSSIQTAKLVSTESALESAIPQF